MAVGLCPLCPVILGTASWCQGCEAVCAMGSGPLVPPEPACGVSLQDYELFVEAVEQNTLQEFLKLA